MRARALSLFSLGRLSSVYLWLVASLIAGGVSYGFGQSQNLFVFRAAARALVAGEDPYVKRAADYFKYSPTFALLFMPFAWVPPVVAAYAWSVLNFGVAYLGITRTVADPARRRVALAVALFGVALATDGDQSNLLIVGLFLLAVQAFERGAVADGCTMVVAGGFIKVFPAVGAVFALLHPRRRAAIPILGAATLAFALFPLTVVTPPALLRDYRAWTAVLSWDHENRGWSAIHMLQTGLGLRASNTVLQLAGVLLLALPIGLGARFGSDAAWRRTLACSCLSFGVLFNHRAEYATYAISAAAAAIWLASSERSPWKTAIVVAALIAPGPFFVRPDPRVTGLFSFVAAHRIFHPLRVLPTFGVWLWMQRDLVARFVEIRVRWRAPERHA